MSDDFADTLSSDSYIDDYTSNEELEEQLNENQKALQRKLNAIGSKYKDSGHFATNNESEVVYIGTLRAVALRLSSDRSLELTVDDTHTLQIDDIDIVCQQLVYSTRKRGQTATTQSVDRVTYLLPTTSLLNAVLRTEKNTVHQMRTNAIDQLFVHCERMVPGMGYQKFASLEHLTCFLADLPSTFLWWYM